MFCGIFFLCDLTDVRNLISGSCAFSKSSLSIWKFLVHVLLKPLLLLLSCFSRVWLCATPQTASLENFGCYFATTHVRWVQLCLWTQTPGGHRQNLVRTKTQEKGAVAPLETKPAFSYILVWLDWLRRLFEISCGKIRTNFLSNPVFAVFSTWNCFSLVLSMICSSLLNPNVDWIRIASCLLSIFSGAYSNRWS